LAGSRQMVFLETAVLYILVFCLDLFSTREQIAQVVGSSTTLRVKDIMCKAQNYIQIVAQLKQLLLA
jgi:hypothetical protein